MPFNVTQFRAELEDDGARPNLFEVNLVFPSFATGAGNAQVASQKITFMCKGAQLPGVTMGLVPLMYWGREVKVWGNKTFQDWTVTIYNDEDFSVRTALERWMAAGNSHGGNLRSTNARNSFGYGIDADVFQYKKTGEKAKQYRFIGLFPIDLAPIDLDWGANDQIEEYTCTFAYQFWTDPRNGIV